MKHGQSPFRVADQRSGQAQQACADLEKGPSRSFDIDVELDLLVLPARANHPTFLDETIRLCDGYDRGILQPGQEPGQMGAEILANKQHMAGLGLRDLVEVQYASRVRSSRLQADGPFLIPIKWSSRALLILPTETAFE